AVPRAHVAQIVAAVEQLVIGRVAVIPAVGDELVNGNLPPIVRRRKISVAAPSPGVVRGDGTGIRVHVPRAVAGCPRRGTQQRSTGHSCQQKQQGDNSLWTDDRTSLVGNYKINIDAAILSGRAGEGKAHKHAVTQQLALCPCSKVFSGYDASNAARYT